MDMVVNELRIRRIRNSGNFVVSGKSKRGWTTFLISAIDPRINAFVPIVFDFLNMRVNTHVQYRMLNRGYSFAFKDYHDFQLTKFIDSPQLEEILKLIDPYCKKKI